MGNGLNLTLRGFYLLAFSVEVFYPITAPVRPVGMFFYLFLTLF